MPRFSACCKTCLIIVLLICCGLAAAQELQDVVPDEPANSEGQIMLAEPDGSKLRMATTLKDYVFQGSPEWSRDGKVLAFDCRFAGMNNNAGSRIAVVNVDGTNPRVFGPGMMPSLSPQGNQLAFSSNRQGGVWIQEIADPAPEPRLIEQNAWGTAWSPDGTRIVYSSYNPVNLIVYDVIEGTKTPVFAKDQIPYRGIQWNFTWSPDSRQIAFKGFTKDGKSVLAIVDARGAEHGHRVRLEQNFLPTLAWSPDGKQILFAAACPERNGIQQIYSIDPETNKPPELLTGQAANRQQEDMSFSPDGKKLALMVMPPRKK